MSTAQRRGFDTRGIVLGAAGVGLIVGVLGFSLASSDGVGALNDVGAQGLILTLASLWSIGASLAIGAVVVSSFLDLSTWVRRWVGRGCIGLAVASVVVLAVAVACVVSKWAAIRFIDDFDAFAMILVALALTTVAAGIACIDAEGRRGGTALNVVSGVVTAVVAIVALGVTVFMSAGHDGVEEGGPTLAVEQLPPSAYRVNLEPGQRVVAHNDGFAVYDDESLAVYSTAGEPLWSMDLSLMGDGDVQVAAFVRRGDGQLRDLVVRRGEVTAEFNARVGRLEAKTYGSARRIPTAKTMPATDDFEVVGADVVQRDSRAVVLAAPCGDHDLLGLEAMAFDDVVVHCAGDAVVVLLNR